MSLFVVLPQDVEDRVKSVRFSALVGGRRVRRCFLTIVTKKKRLRYLYRYQFFKCVCVRVCVCTATY